MSLGGKAPKPSTKSSMRSTRMPPTDDGGLGAQPRHDLADARQVGDPQRDLRRGEARRTARRSRRGGRRSCGPAAFSSRGQREERRPRPRCRPCRAPSRGPRGSRGPPRSRRRAPVAREIHLKPVSVVGEVEAVVRARPPRAPGRRRSSTRACRSAGVAGASAARRAACQPSSSPTSLPLRRRQPSRLEASGIATARRSASGSFAMTSSASAARAVCEARGPSRPAPRGSGTRPSGTRDRARSARRRSSASVEAGGGEHARRGLPPDAVHRRVDERAAARSARRRRARRSRATYSSTTASSAPSRSRSSAAARASIGVAATRWIARGDLGVGGRDDLRAVVVAAEVHLVAVVARRVVARRSP